MSSSLQQVLQAVVGHAFHLERELPGAGMSRVFLAREPALARDVVIKVLPPDLLSTASLQRFTREIQVTARLQHPYILPVITAGGTDELRYYVTPFIRGESLRARLAADSGLPFADAMRIGDQLLQAIAFAHARGVIHRDVKPGNILLSDGHAILADFGIASFVRVENPADHADHMSGTLDAGRVYVAPEEPRDEARDLYAAAVVIHEMVAGVPAAAGTPAAAIVAAIRARQPQAPNGELRKLASILSRALSADPRDRFATAGELRAAIHSLNHESRRHVYTAVGVASAAAVLAIAMLSFRQQPPPTPPDAQPRPIAAPTDIRVSTPMPVPTANVIAQSGEVSAPPPDAKAPPAMRAIDSANFLFAQGDLTSADALYALAIRDNPEDSRAQLGAAIVASMANRPADTEASRIAAARALTGTPALDEHDRSIAEGLIALADRRYPEACTVFEQARQARESMEAFFGLGECRMRDDAVIFGADGAPRFRSSYVDAFNAYASATRAAAPNAPFVVYRRLMATVPITSADVRMGRTADNRAFAGNWLVDGDTLGLILAPSGQPRAIAPAIFAAAGDAAKIGRDKLRPILLAWVDHAPRDVAAWETLALLLESSGTISAVGDDRISALTAIENARAFSGEASALRLASVHARLLLRAGQYRALAALSDSMLAAHPTPAGNEAEPLLPFALLTGRVSRAVDLLSHVSGMTNRAVRGSDGRPVNLPATAIAERADFLVRATLGVCDERVQSAPKRLLDVLDAAFPAGVPRGVESAFVERITLFALPCLGASVVHTLREPGRSLPMYARAFDPADTAFPGEFAARERARPALVPGAEAGVDGVIVDVLAKLAMKDTASAQRALTLALDRIPIVNRGILTSEWSIGSTIRGMAIAADVAAATGDRETAQRWASAVATLWHDADTELQPVVARMRAIMESRQGDSRRE